MAGIGSKLSHSNDLIGARSNDDLHVAPPSVVSMWSLAVLLSCGMVGWQELVS